MPSLTAACKKTGIAPGIMSLSNFSVLTTLPWVKLKVMLWPSGQSAEPPVHSAQPTTLLAGLCRLSRSEAMAVQKRLPVDSNDNKELA